MNLMVQPFKVSNAWFMLELTASDVFRETLTAKHSDVCPSMSMRQGVDRLCWDSSDMTLGLKD